MEYINYHKKSYTYSYTIKEQDSLNKSSCYTKQRTTAAIQYTRADIQFLDMRLNLSTDNAKPRSKWTWLLHQQFIDVVAQLGATDKATPKPLTSIQAITSYHLKSHLQKYRQGKYHQLSQTYNDDYKEDNSENQTNPLGDETHNQLNENLQVSPSQWELQMQLQEQIKVINLESVQQHLQLRTESQGKYIDTILKKAQDILGNYSNDGSQSSCLSLKHSPTDSSDRIEKSGYSNEYNGSRKKRSGSTISDGSCVEQSPCKRAATDRNHGEFRVLQDIDLNKSLCE